MPRARSQALVYGSSRDLIAAVPTLLSRAGFAVTLMTTAWQLHGCRHVDRLLKVGDRAELVSSAAVEARQGYDLVVAGDDDTLHRVRHADLPLEDKLRILPVTDEEGLGHIASKIGLSRVLARANIATPQFDAANDAAELRRIADRLGYPLVVKDDVGGGGHGVYFVDTPEQLAAALERADFPVLVQRRLDGELVDCASFFKGGELVCFSYATVLEATRGGIGPSIIRRYRTHPEHDKVLVDTLVSLGRALHANGFANISALRTSDGTLSVIEADMRPNAWIDAPRLYGDDPAVAIARAYGNAGPVGAASPDHPAEMIVTNALRMPYGDLVRNTHRCRGHYVNYLGRGLVIDRLERSIEQLTSRRIVDGLRRLVGLPPAARRRRKISLATN